MERRVSIEEIVKALNATVLFGGEHDYVGGVVASGLMSDVLASDEDEILLISNLTTTQLIRTADMVGAHAVLVTNNKTVSDEVCEMAQDVSITLMVTSHPVFETCCLLGKIFNI